MGLHGRAAPVFVLRCVVAAVIGLSACHRSAAPDTRMTSDGSVTFATGHAIGMVRPGSFTEQRTGQEHVFFADVASSKQLIFFDPQGHRERIVPLDAAVDSLGEIGWISVASWDSILVMSMYTSRLALLDTSGRCRSVTDLAPLLKNAQGDVFEAWGSFSSGFLIGHDLFLAIEWRENTNDQENRSEPTDRLGKERYFNTHAARAPHLVRIRLGSPAPTVTWILPGFYAHLSNEPVALLPFSRYACVNSRLFAPSNHTPYVYVVDPRTGIATDTISVRSALTPTFVKAPVLDPAQVARGQAYANECMEIRGAMVVVDRDPPSGHYLVGVVHEVPPSAPANERGDARAYSLLEFDADLHFLREHVFDGRSHRMDDLLTLQNGTWIMRHEDGAAQLAGVHVFDHYTFGP